MLKYSSLFCAKTKTYNETEQKIEKIKKTINETNKYCKEINDIYLKNMKIQPQANIEDIQWNENTIKPNNDKAKSSYIDIDNNEPGSNLNNEEYNRFRNNAFDINTNDDYRNNNNGKSLLLIKLLGLCLLGLGFADGFYRNEFSCYLWIYSKG